MNAACGWTLIRKTSLLRKINPTMRRSSFTNKDIYQPAHLAMNERRNVPEIVIAICELLRRSQTRINLLFTMSEIPHPRPVKDDACEVMFSRTMFLWRPGLAIMVSPSSLFRAAPGTLRSACPAAPRIAEGEAWWSQTGSNRRPHACKARALPAELWPRTRRRMLLLRSPSLALRRSSLCSRRPAEPKLQSSEGWWAWEDLNFRPHAYQARALTN
jgi:hypothetical protein